MPILSVTSFLARAWQFLVNLTPTLFSKLKRQRREGTLTMQLSVFAANACGCGKLSWKTSNRETDSLLKMFSMSLHISFSGLLRHVLAHFTDVLIILERMAQCKASNISETQSLNSVKLLQKILPRKMLEHVSLEREFIGANRSKHITKSNQPRLKTHFSVDSVVKQENLFPKLRNEASLSSEVVARKSGPMSHPRSKACSRSRSSCFCKGKGVVLDSVAEELNTRLTILEEENEIMKQAFLETVMERKELVNEVCQLFQTLSCSFPPNDHQDGQKSGCGSLIIKPS